MRSLSATELLDIWEQGLERYPAERALDLLAAGDPGMSRDDLARMPVGERDGALLSLRDLVFGPTLDAVTRCPACNELLETTIRSSDIRNPPVADRPDRFSLQAQEYSVQFRLPDSNDLIAISNLDDAAAAEKTLMERCILQVRKGSADVPPGQLPEGVIAAVMDQMDRSDPQANTHLCLTCPSCGNTWEEPFDVLSFFWNEIDNWANRTLDEVHVLALAYGWSEPGILSMSAKRRQLYLEKVVE
jgi:hypothetical protein